MSSERVSVNRRIQAPAGHLFGIVTDPHMHVEIDGSGMLMAAPDAVPMTAVGESFIMNMDREPLGDIPMGKYTVRNTVTKIVPESEFEWTIGGVDQPPMGHVYGYTLEADGDDATNVTLYCDWSNIIDGLRERNLDWPVVPVHMLEKSLDKLDAVATRPAS